MILRFFSFENSLPRVVSAEVGQTFAQAIWLSGSVKPTALCGGLGLCGRCKCRFLHDPPLPVEKELKFFSQSEIEAGWRLACTHMIGKSQESVDLLIPEFHCSSENESFKTFPHENIALGVDLGTTSIEWRAVSLAQEKTISSGKMLNPQAGAGADVISRLCYARKGDNLNRLSNLVIQALREIVAKNGGSQISRLCVAGNSAMIEIMLKKDISGLCAAPYSLSWHGGELIHGNDFSDLPEIIIPPLPSPFIGADISAGILDLLERNIPRPFLLADLGTNVEFALLLPDNKLFLTSAPAGPAMEGIGPQCGQLAGDNVAVNFKISANGLEAEYYKNINPSIPLGISATGYLSLLSRLLKLEIMDDHGYFVEFDKLTMPLARKIAKNFSMVNGIKRLTLEGGIFLSSADVEILLKVRSAFVTAMHILLEKAKINIEDLAAFCLSGAISEYANIEDLVITGFAPRSIENRILFCQNTSLNGACILVKYPEKLDQLKQICLEATIVSLNDNDKFMQKYFAEMVWKEI